MKQGLIELVFILDRSGSMASLTSDTIGGFNSMIEKQKQEPGEAYVTTVLFDSQYEIFHDHVPLADIPALTSKEYYARGTTALLDAIGRTVNSIGARLNATPEDERPDKVVIVITTDGLENASKEFSRSAVKQMITHQQDKYSWTFVFLGANMDAVTEARSLGINANFSRSYHATSRGTEKLFTGVSDAVTCMRAAESSQCYEEDSAVFDCLMHIFDKIEDDDDQQEEK